MQGKGECPVGPGSHSRELQGGAVSGVDALDTTKV